ncbi:hypothetical protein ACWEQO_02115 [Streptomyces sp. NPDC004051]
MAKSAMPIPSVDRLMDAPLPVLMNELGVTLFDSDITDREFFGAVVERKTGELILSLPAGRSELERDTVARYLLAQALGVKVAPMPAPLVTSRSDEGGPGDVVQAALTPEQADGLACIHCGRMDTPMKPVGTRDGVQLFACTPACPADDDSDPDMDEALRRVRGGRSA